MRIIIHKGYNNYMTHDFVSKDIDKIMKVCYDLNIKRYSLVFSDKEKDDYERFFKRSN